MLKAPLVTNLKVEGLSLLSQFFLTGMSACLSKFYGHEDLLNISLPIFKFVTRGAFNNHGNHPACLSVGISGWTSLKGLGNRGAEVASTLADIGAQDSRLINAEKLACGEKVTLSVIFGSENLRREFEKFCYILTGLFGYACPYVR